jgi:hypothetical protein
MSYKTDRLVDLLPDVYAAAEPGSLLQRLLDTVGAELMTADAAVKRLLRSHWVDHATGRALDGLGAIYGVARRPLRDGSLESDAEFRRRLRSVVSLFTGGGTVLAVKGAVRSALGLPFDLRPLILPVGMREDLEDLVLLEEFPPIRERVVDDAVIPGDDGSELVLQTDAPATEAAPARIEWTMTAGGGRLLSVERTDLHRGVMSDEDLLVAAGTTLVLTSGPAGALSAVLDGRDVSNSFTNLDGSIPAVLPHVPPAHSEWRFRVRGAVHDLSAFDAGETFDSPSFRVQLSWLRPQPLTFDVTVPYFLQSVVDQLVKRYGYTGEVFVFQGLPLEVIPEVVDQTRAAGVRGGLHFSLEFLEDHRQRDGVRLHAVHSATEDADAADSLTMGSLSAAVEDQDAADRFGLAAPFDVATFDGPFSYG